MSAVRRRPSPKLTRALRERIEDWARGLNVDARELVSAHDLAALADMLGWWVVNDLPNDPKIRQEES